MAFTLREPRNLFRRCLVCPDQAPSCKACPAGEICVLLPLTCDACPSTNCLPQDKVPGNVQSSKGGTNVGAIAGGVVGGVVVLILAIFLFWRFFLKDRRKEIEEQQPEWQTVEITTEKADQSDFNERRDARASTHTVASLASSVLTRASNIIQIAYIPGVTNRGAGSPGVLVPPVPPIPIPTSPSTTACSPFSTEDQHFFLPGDLRDSTYSGLSDGRSSYARTSIAPSLARSSVATTIYRSNAIVSPLPAQTIVRGKAAVVSVKSSQANSPVQSPAETPPVPSIDFEKHKAPVRIQMPRSTDGSLQPSPQGSLKGVYAKPVPLNLSKGKITTTSTTSSSSAASSFKSSPATKPRPLTEVSVADSEMTDHARAHRSETRSVYTDSIVSDSDSDDGDDHARSRRSLLGNSPELRSSQLTDIQDTPGMLQSPFLDAPDTPDALARHPKKQSSNLATVVEESSKRASRDRNGSPFSDAHAVPGS